MGVSIVGGYLGERLVEKYADRLMGQVKKEVEEGERRSVSKANLRTEIVDGIRGVEARLARGLLTGAFREIQNLTKKSLSQEERAHVRLLKAYVLKRWDRLPEAIDEVEKSLEENQTYIGWYNKACYLAKQQQINKPTSLDPAVGEALQKSMDLVGDDPAEQEFLRKTIEQDLEEDGDLIEYKNNHVIKLVLNHVDSQS